MKTTISVKLAILAVVLTIGAGSAAVASEILPGFDLFETQPGTFVDLSDFGLGVVQTLAHHRRPEPGPGQRASA